ncbi:MFS transporter [Leuconostoc gelidum subsp. gasicomitatum]|uniref:MFS transporter n=1 Tax=Leuconostoc gasicomitatum TaxID=115778 RepID=UPI001CC332C3|nr:MFS transporter [Leuconostoc gasicomitatum]MBZ5985373.1 MFS transporter [Leuconostoc gasicomitatum]
MNYIRILKNKVFRQLFTSIILTNLANSISSISLIWIAYNKFNSPVVIAIVLGALQLPNIILGPFLGGLLDKFNKIKLMTFANIVNASVFLFLIFNPLASRIDISVFILLLVLSGSMKPLLVGGDSIGIHGLLFSFIGLIKNLWLICILLILIGFIVSPALIYKTTFYQKAFDEESKGALFTIAGSMTSSSYPLGIMVTSLLATFKNGIAIPYVFLFYGLTIVILSVIVYRNVLLKSK